MAAGEMAQGLEHVQLIQRTWFLRFRVWFLALTLGSSPLSIIPAPVTPSPGLKRHLHPYAYHIYTHNFKKIKILKLQTSRQFILKNFSVILQKMTIYYAHI